MFGKNKAEEANAALRVMNQFGNGTTINGDVIAEGDVRIDGKVTGNVTSKSKVVIGATGVIDGNIYCSNGYIDGRVNGHIEVSELLILSKTAHVTGDIKIKKLVVEEGAKFNGRCTMGMSMVRNQTETQDAPMAKSKATAAV
ncbi:MAG: polymer-forming cytoskeletal protein [Chitinophagales bacterium]